MYSLRLPSRVRLSLALLVCLTLPSLAQEPSTDTTTIASPESVEPAPPQPLDESESGLTPEERSMRMKDEGNRFPQEQAPPPEDLMNSQGPNPRDLGEPTSEPTSSDTPAGVGISGPVVGENDSVFEENPTIEKRIKSDPRASKLYRSPRKAFFLSLALPGAGQIYVGSWFRAAVFASAEVGLGIGWYQKAIVGARNKAREADRFADSNWSMLRYEIARDSLFRQAGQDSQNIRLAMSQRKSYCINLYAKLDEEEPSSDLYTGCLESVLDSSANRSNHMNWVIKADSTWSTSVKNATDVRTQIGLKDEFLLGWEDASGTNVATVLNWYNLATDNNPTTVPPAQPFGRSDMRSQYLDLRLQADNLARTQKYFLGGMILNHLVAAIDAALTAGKINRSLYKLESNDPTATSWLDGLNVHGGFAWLNGPVSGVHVAWSY